MDIMLTTRYLDDLAACGVTIPAASANARAIYEAALAAAARHPSTELKAALEAGQVTSENVASLVFEAASSLTAQASAHQIIRELHQPLNRAMRDGLRENAERIHAELKATFEPAAAAVMKAAQHFGPETSSDEVVTMKPDVVKLWNQVNGHSTTLETVARLYRTLLSDLLGALPAQQVSLYVTEATDLNHADDIYRGRNRWLALASEGYTLTLNTAAEAARVTAGAEAVQTRAAEAERTANIKANRFRHRFDLAAAKGGLL